jgi:ubiquitin-associated SH3 domain-containing protein
MRIAVEPGLFEWLGWYPKGPPTWLNQDEYVNAGYLTDPNYRPCISRQELAERHVRESTEEFYLRNHDVTQRIINACPDGDILLVAHGPAVDTCTRLARGLPPRSHAAMMAFLPQTPYCSTVIMRQESLVGRLTLVDLPQVIHHVIPSWDWRMLY